MAKKQILLSVTGQVLSCTNEDSLHIASGSIGQYEVVVTLDDWWTDYDVSVQFRKYGIVIENSLDEENTCSDFDAILASGGSFEVTVFGLDTSGNEKTTNPVSIDVSDSGLRNSAPVTFLQSIWNKIRIMLAGGTTGQFLRKTSDVDYEAEWVDGYDKEEIDDLVYDKLIIYTPAEGETIPEASVDNYNQALLWNGETSGDYKTGHIFVCRYNESTETYYWYDITANGNVPSGILKGSGGNIFSATAHTDYEPALPETTENTPARFLKGGAANSRSFSQVNATDVVYTYTGEEHNTFIEAVGNLFTNNADSGINLALAELGHTVADYAENTVYENISIDSDNWVDLGIEYEYRYKATIRLPLFPKVTGGIFKMNDFRCGYWHPSLKYKIHFRDEERFSNNYNLGSGITYLTYPPGFDPFPETQPDPITFDIYSKTNSEIIIPYIICEVGIIGSTAFPSVYNGATEGWDVHSVSNYDLTKVVIETNAVFSTSLPAAVLPSMVDNEKKVLTTNGTTASWSNRIGNLTILGTNVSYSDPTSYTLTNQQKSQTFMVEGNGSAYIGGLDTTNHVETVFGASTNGNGFGGTTSNDDFEVRANNIKRIFIDADGAVSFCSTSGTPNVSVDSSGTIQPTGYKSSDGSAGVSGTFTTTDSKTVTVKDGIITSIV